MTGPCRGWGALILLALILAGCALTPERGDMVPPTYKIKERHHGTVQIQVSGGQEASRQPGGGIHWNLPDELFAEALAEALTKSGLFTRVASAREADFRIQVTLKRLFLPPGSLGEMESQLAALWVLKDAKSDEVLWQDFIVTTGLTSFSEAPSGATRIKRSMARAANSNIFRAIHEISLESLPEHENLAQTRAASTIASRPRDGGASELTDKQRAVAAQLMGTWQGIVKRGPGRSDAKRTLVIRSLATENGKLIALGDYVNPGRASRPVAIRVEEEEDGAPRLIFNAGGGSRIRLALRDKRLTGVSELRSSEVQEVQFDRVE